MIRLTRRLGQAMTKGAIARAIKHCNQMIYEAETVQGMRGIDDAAVEAFMMRSRDAQIIKSILEGEEDGD